MFWSCMHRGLVSEGEQWIENPLKCSLLIKHYIFYCLKFAATLKLSECEKETCWSAIERSSAADLTCVEIIIVCNNSTCFQIYSFMKLTTPLTALKARHTLCICVSVRKRDHYECPEIRFIPVKISSFQIIKKWQQAVVFFHTKNSWNMACEKCARWPSYRRCRGGINLITASNIHLANISRLETQAQKWQASLAGAHNSGWQMTVIHEKRPDIYRIYREGLAIPDLWCLDLLIGMLNAGNIYNNPNLFFFPLLWLLNFQIDLG